MSYKKAYILSIIICFQCLIGTNDLSGQTIKVLPDYIFTLKDSCIDFLPMRNDIVNRTTKIISISFQPFHSNATIEIIDDSTIRYCDVIPSIFIDDTLTYRVFDLFSGKTDTGFIYIKKAARNKENVWSGDINNDGICNHLDVLFWANVVNKKGLARHQIATVWKPMAMIDAAWRDTSTLKTLSYYADANGDNTVDIMDTTAFQVNFGKTHPLTDSINYNLITDFNYPIVPVELKVMNPSLKNQDTLTLRIQVGDFSNPLTNISGIAFTLEYNDNVFKNNSAFFYQTDNSWISHQATDKFSMLETKSQAGQLFGVDTRLARSKTNGGGGAGDIKIIIDDVIIQSAKLSGKDVVFNIKDVYLIGGNSDLFIRTSAKGDTIKSNQWISSGVDALRGEIPLFFHQTAQSIDITMADLSLIGTKIVLRNAMGTNLSEEIIHETKTSMPIENLPNGIYFLDINHVQTNMHKTFKFITYK
ncbi:MAG: hypothetical protein IPK03_09875 [Bacteroidetes bacterium]|nr:hypothetical protein [Bacteroidota bacterium]